MKRFVSWSFVFTVILSLFCGQVVFAESSEHVMLGMAEHIEQQNPGVNCCDSHDPETGLALIPKLNDETELDIVVNGFIHYELEFFTNDFSDSLIFWDLPSFNNLLTGIVVKRE